jgi:hypothetical protein
MLALLTASIAPAALASGPGGGTSGGGSSSGSGGSGGGGGGTVVNAGSCAAISSFTNTATYDPFPSVNPATATVINTQLTGSSTCASGGPYTVRISYKNDFNNAVVQTNASQWVVPGNFSGADGTFSTPSTPYTVSYTVTDGSGHVFLSGSQNITTPLSK